MPPSPNFIVASARQLYGHALPPPTPPLTGALPQPKTQHSPPNRPPLRHKSQRIVRPTRTPSPETKSNASSTPSNQSSDFNSFGASTISLLRDFPVPPNDGAGSRELSPLVAPTVVAGSESGVQRRPSTSGRGGEIYFSPVEAKGGRVELSSPLPSPEIAVPTDSPTEGHMAKPGSVQVCLTAKQVNELSVAIANSPLVHATLTMSHNSRPHAPKEDSDIDAPFAPDYALFADVNVGRTFVSDLETGFGPGVPSTTGDVTSLHITPPSAEQSESNIVLLTNTSLARSSKDRRPIATSSLSTQTDLTLFCLCAALSELSRSTGLALEEIGIQQPNAAKVASQPGIPESTDSEIDWCAFADEDEQASLALEPSVIEHESEPTNVADEAVARCLARIAGLASDFASPETLTLVDTITQLRAASTSFMVLEPTRYDHFTGTTGGVRVLGVSTALRVQLGSGKQCRALGEVVVEAVVPQWAAEEEIEVDFTIEGKQGWVRAIPLLSSRGKDSRVGRWLCLISL
ncbi:hypothetical protein B0A48_03503 [Cryoendolithus antarcticus]|uniref:Uncharacterized protein n=1 Tax=Cryoendolithus antarcticus TaxID=1507870 RepID=A0A1V8TK73_9PEZI|nr:hypothetical protein B0A48_03503 [Cryoendolithus antarcticus]